MNLEQGDKCYRTLVRGKLVQRSGLTVGGSPLDPTGSDIQCHRDGAEDSRFPVRVSPERSSRRPRGSVRSWSNRVVQSACTTAMRTKTWTVCRGNRGTAARKSGRLAKANPKCISRFSTSIHVTW